MVRTSRARLALACLALDLLGCRSGARAVPSDAATAAPDAATHDAAPAPDGGGDASAPVAREILRVLTEQGTTDWSTGIVGFFPLSEGEAFIAFGLHLFRVTRETTGALVFDPARSRGLPVQSDPCTAPEVDELRREPTGRLVATLRDHGSPHFTGGCLDREPTDLAYAWSSDRGRWTPLPAPPAWARAASRAIYTEARVDGHLVRLMGPRVSPGSDGWNPPTAYDPLNACFADAGRSRWASYEVLPEKLAALPADLCVEGVRFGASGDDAVFVGRTRDGTTWLERIRPGSANADAGADAGTAAAKNAGTRLRVPFPRGCKTRASGSITRIAALDAGELTLGVDCSSGRDEPGAWTSRVHSFQFDFARGTIKASAVRDLSFDDVREPPDAALGMPPLRGFRWVGDPRAARALYFGDRKVLDEAHHFVAFGERSALVEKGGRVFLVAPAGPEPSPPPPLTLRADTTPPLEVLSLDARVSSGSDACGSATFWIATRVPAEDAARLAALREKVAALESAHPELVRDADPMTELRIGDEWVLGRYDPAAFDPMTGDAARALRTKHDAWARAVGLTPSATCLPRAPRIAPPRSAGSLVGEEPTLAVVRARALDRVDAELLHAVADHDGGD